MKKIALIIPWFGPFPKWMPVYLHTCKFNSSIDYHFFTDQEMPDYAPDNVKSTKINFDSYCKKVSEALEIDFSPEENYKLCDIKPSYGEVHRELVKDYDFWGFADIDVVQGDLRHFLTEEKLGKYNLISCHGSRISGHFTIMRTNDEWRRMFMNAKNWKNAFERKDHVAFDEKAFSDLFMGFKNYPVKMRDALRWLFMPRSRQTEIKEAFSTPSLRYNWIDDSRNFPTEWYWQDGRLTNNVSQDQFMYLHFLKWKRDWKDNNSVSYLNYEELNDKIVIDENGFHVV